MTWVPIADDSDVLGAGGAMHGPVQARVTANFAEHLRSHVYHGGVHCWPRGLAGGFARATVASASTRGVQASTHPGQWLCALEWDFAARWADLDPTEWVCRLHVCAAARQGPVHCLLAGAGTTPTLVDLGSPGAQVLADPGYFLLTADTDPPTVRTVDIPLEDIFGAVSGKPYGVEERGFRLWFLSGLGETTQDVGVQRIDRLGRTLEIAGAGSATPWRKAHLLVTFTRLGGSGATVGAVIDQPGVRRSYLAMATDDRRVTVYPSIAQEIRQRLTPSDDVQFRALGYLEIMSAHVEIVPRAVVDFAGSSS